MMKRNYIVPKVRCVTLESEDLATTYIITSVIVNPTDIEDVEDININIGGDGNVGVDEWDAKMQNLWDNEW